MEESSNSILGKLLIKDTIQWILNDYRSNKYRFILEVFAWIGSVGSALIMALTVPHPPLMLLYPIWITSCGIYAWCAWTRHSVGMLFNYLLLMSIDISALIRMLFFQ